MKKITTLVALLLSIGIYAQKQYFKDFQAIKIENLETVCDCGNAFMSGTIIEIEFLNNPKKYKYKQEKESEKVAEWQEKMKAIQMHCTQYKKYAIADIKKCNNVQMVLDLRDKTKEEYSKNK